MPEVTLEEASGHEPVAPAPFTGPFNARSMDQPLQHAAQLVLDFTLVLLQLLLRH